MADRAKALSVWNMRWPESLRIEHQYDPAYIAQREAFIDGYIAALNESKEAP